MLVGELILSRGQCARLDRCPCPRASPCFSPSPPCGIPIRTAPSSLRLGATPPNDTARTMPARPQSCTLAIHHSCQSQRLACRVTADFPISGFHQSSILTLPSPDLARIRPPFIPNVFPWRRCPPAKPRVSLSIHRLWPSMPSNPPSATVHEPREAPF